MIYLNKNINHFIMNQENIDIKCTNCGKNICIQHPYYSIHVNLLEFIHEVSTFLCKECKERKETK